jgi:hypothetical protein
MIFLIPTRQWVETQLTLQLAQPILPLPFPARGLARNRVAQPAPSIVFFRVAHWPARFLAQRQHRSA